jgi:DNA-binding beta-propeller fold protein YncE
MKSRRSSEVKMSLLALLAILLSAGVVVFTANGLSQSTSLSSKAAVRTNSISYCKLNRYTNKADNISRPMGVAYNPVLDRIYVVSSGTQRVRYYDARTLAFLGEFGAGVFSNPAGVAVDTNGNVYVTDQDLDKVYKFDAVGVQVPGWEVTGVNRPFGITIYRNQGYGIESIDTVNLYTFSLQTGAKNEIEAGVLDFPYGIAITSDISGTNEYLFLSDLNRPGGKSIWRYKLPVDPQQRIYWNTTDRTANYLTIDSAQRLYVALEDGNKVEVYDLNGNLLYTIGSFGSGNGQFNKAHGVVVKEDFKDRSLFVADYLNNRIQKFGCEAGVQ